MNPVDTCLSELRRLQCTFLAALLVGVCVVSIPNIYFALGALGYADFWRATFGNKPMSVSTEAICRASLPYSGLAILIPVAAVCASLLRFSITTTIRCALAGVALASVQLLSSLYFLWHEWWITAINGRFYP